MKLRVAWYAIVPASLSEDARAFGAIVLTADRCAFWLAVVFAIACHPGAPADALVVAVKLARIAAWVEPRGGVILLWPDPGGSVRPL